MKFYSLVWKESLKLRSQCKENQRQKSIENYPKIKKNILVTKALHIRRYTLRFSYHTLEFIKD